MDHEQRWIKNKIVCLPGKMSPMAQNESYNYLCINSFIVPDAIVTWLHVVHCLIHGRKVLIGSVWVNSICFTIQYYGFDSNRNVYSTSSLLPNIDEISNAQVSIFIYIIFFWFWKFKNWIGTYFVMNFSV